MPTITADEFEKQYLARCQANYSTMTLESLREHSKVVPCDCDYEQCEGWGMISLNGHNCGECGHYIFHHGNDEGTGACHCGCSDYTDERRWPRE